MKIYEKYTPEPKELERLIVVKCDICGKTSKNNWKESNFDAIDSTVFLRIGKNYPEGSWGEITEIDICPYCFENALVPWVRSLGGEPTVREWDY